MWSVASGGRERLRPGASGGGEIPVGRLLARIPRDRAALLRSGGLDGAGLRELAATAEGERQVRALLTAPAPAPRDLLPLDRAGTDVLLDALGEDNRQALRQRGLDLDLMLRLCGTPDGQALVRTLVMPPPLVLPPDDLPPPPRPPLPRITGRRVLVAWLRVVAGALAGVALCAGAGALIGGAALLVGLAWLILGVAVMALTVPFTRGRGAACAAVAGAFLVLAAVTCFSVSDWYLAVRGVAVRATVVSPSWQQERSARIPHCRVRLPDGTVERVASNDTGCVRSEVGRPTTVMNDPSGWFAPHLGGPADLNLAPTLAVAGSAGAVLVLAPAAAVAAAAAERGRLGKRGGTT